MLVSTTFILCTKLGTSVAITTMPIVSIRRLRAAEPNYFSIDGKLAKTSQRI